MNKNAFENWLMNQQNISHTTIKDYVYRLCKICKRSGFGNMSGAWDLLAVHVDDLIENYQNKKLHNDVSALKKFNMFLYEIKWGCQNWFTENIEPIMKMLSWFPGSETEAPQIRTSCNNGEDDLLTPTQVAYYLKTTTKTLRQWRIQGKHLPYLDFPNGIKYPRSAVNKLLKTRYHEILLSK
jgi:hypothetical protein